MGLMILILKMSTHQNISFNTDAITKKNRISEPLLCFGFNWSIPSAILYTIKTICGQWQAQSLFSFLQTAAAAYNYDTLG